MKQRKTLAQREEELHADLLALCENEPIWTVLYSHCGGDVGMQCGLTFAQAQRSKSELESGTHLDWVKILIEYDA